VRELRYTRIFGQNSSAWLDGKRRSLNEGGTASSKTWSILQLLEQIARGTKSPLLISVVSESLPHLKRGAIRDFFRILGTTSKTDSQYNMTENTYTFGDGVIEFFGADEAAKVRGPRRDILFINEANNVPWETARGLDIRTRAFTIIDWNPVSEFWAHEYWVGQPENTYIHSTYLDAVDVLPPEIVANIESNKDKDPNWWNIYGLGLIGKVEGLVYPVFSQVNELPHGQEFYGLDFGYSCLRGDTLVVTDKGNREIRNIKRGDRVLTRRCYREVTWSGSRGVKQVYELDFGHEKRIIVTGDHLIYTANGWQRADRLRKEETICALKLNSTGKSIGDTLTANTRITFIAKMVGVARPLSYIGKSGKKISGKFHRMALSTIRTAIPLTMASETLSWLLTASIKKFITEINSAQYHLKRCAISAQNTGLQLITGENAMKRAWIPQGSGSKIVLSAARKSRQRIPTKNSVAISVEKEQTQGEAEKNIFVKIAARHLWPQRISREMPVLQNVQVRLRLLKEKCEVFDLTVGGEHEFFANGILVHNCDPTVLVRNVIRGDDLFSQELIFEKGLTNDAIAYMMADLGVQKHYDEIFADSAEPKSIEEIFQHGFNIKPCPKGPGSVEYGHQKVRQYRQFWTKDSVNCIKEQRNFRYIPDKDGKLTQKTTHNFSHGMDARRYGVVGAFEPVDEEAVQVYDTISAEGVNLDIE